jgi:hexokinase
LFSESGTFLGLDLGGTNFRVIMIKMTNGEAETTMDNYVIPSDVLCGPVKGVFDFIAGKILEFFQKYKISDVNSPLPLGKKKIILKRNNEMFLLILVAMHCSDDVHTW